MGSLAIWRRAAFVATLLLMGPVTIACVQAIQTYRPAWDPLATGIWGYDSMRLALAAWFVGRATNWKSGSVWIRGFVYLIAFAYGGMLFDAMQDWWVGEKPSFQLPGGEFEQYGRPLLTVLSLLIHIFLLFPVYRLMRLSLQESGQEETVRPASIGDWFVWTTLFAVILIWVKFLSSNWAPDTGYSGASIAVNLREWIVEAPIKLYPLMVMTALLFAWKKHWALAIGVALIGWVFDSLATGWTTVLLEYWTGDSFGGVLGRSPGRWYYVAGRTLLSLTFGGAALALGIRIVSRDGAKSR